MPQIASVINGYEPRVRDLLMQLRALIFDAAAETEGVGALQEALKWGQPAYLTPITKSGSTVRMDRVKGAEKVALYFHCQTTLVPTFREMYADQLTFDGNRAIILDAKSPLPKAELRHCIALALTYHLSKKKRG